MVKKVKLQDLYTQEKQIHKTLNSKRVDIVLRKPTRDEHREALRVLRDARENSFQRFKKEDKQTKTLQKTVDSLSKEELANRIIEFETPERRELLDLYPVENENKETEQEKEFTKWRKNRKKQLSALGATKLRTKLHNFMLNYYAMLEATNQFSDHCIYSMCYYTDGQRVFNSIKEVGQIREPELFEWLKDEVDKFLSIQSSKDIRKAANSSDFTKTGRSQKK